MRTPILAGAGALLLLEVSAGAYNEPLRHAPSNSRQYSVQRAGGMREIRVRRDAFVRGRVTIGNGRTAVLLRRGLVARLTRGRFGRVHAETHATFSGSDALVRVDRTSFRVNRREGGQSMADLYVQHQLGARVPVGESDKAVRQSSARNLLRLSERQQTHLAKAISGGYRRLHIGAWAGIGALALPLGVALVGGMGEAASYGTDVAMAGAEVAMFVGMTGGLGGLAGAAYGGSDARWFSRKAAAALKDGRVIGEFSRKAVEPVRE